MLLFPDRQTILLLDTPVGRAKVTFTADDFLGFLAHPLMVSAVKTSLGSKTELCGPVWFDNDLATVFFIYRTSEQAYQVRMQRDAKGKVLIDIAGASSSMGDLQQSILVDSCSQEEAAKLQNFFNTLLLNLDGTEMSFSEINFSKEVVQRNTSLRQVCMRLGLDICVKAFPPPNVSF